MSSMDYNTNNYTITELLAILELDDPDSDEIMDTTNKLINQFSVAGENQPQLVNFFQSIQTKLLQYMQQLEILGKMPNILQMRNKPMSGGRMKHCLKIVMFKRIK